MLMNTARSNDNWQDTQEGFDSGERICSAEPEGISHYHREYHRDREWQREHHRQRPGRSLYPCHRKQNRRLKERLIVRDP